MPCLCRIMNGGIRTPARLAGGSSQLPAAAAGPVRGRAGSRAGFSLPSIRCPYDVRQAGQRMRHRGRRAPGPWRTGAPARVAGFSWIIASSFAVSGVRAGIARPGRPGDEIVPPLGNVLQVRPVRQSGRPGNSISFHPAAIEFRMLMTYAVLLDTGNGKNGDRHGPESTDLPHRRP